MTDPTAEPSQHDQYRDQIARALHDLRYDNPTGRDVGWGYADNRAMAYEDADRLLAVRDTELAAVRLQAADEWAEHEETKAHLAQARNTIALKDTEMEQLRAEAKRLDAGWAAANLTAARLRGERDLARAEAKSHSNSWSHADERRQELYRENERLRAELAGLRERVVDVQKYWRDWPEERRALVDAVEHPAEDGTT